jgi:hypothetical protein
VAATASEDDGTETAPAHGPEGPPAASAAPAAPAMMVFGPMLALASLEYLFFGDLLRATLSNLSGE